MIHQDNIELFNSNLRYEDPMDIISFVLDLYEKPIVSTSFGTYSAALLFACTQVKNDLAVVWCDTGYNTPATYRHARLLTKKLNLNLEIFTPRLTTAFLESKMGRPDINNPNHVEFSENLKLEPFQRALDKYQPDLWFTNLRKNQTTHRDSLDILSINGKGILKVSPFYHYSDDQLLEFMNTLNLPAEFDYFDPIKALQNRECGIHLKN